jgi:ATP-dependent Clp protease protease subunit
MNPQTPQVVAQASPASMGGLDEQVYSRLLRERIIFLAGQVEDNMANAICAQILLLAAEDTEKDIYLYINSPGGSITAGMAIYDTMQFVPNDIVTVGIGMAASMGQLLLTAGTKGKRYALPNCRIMIHQPLAGLRGTSTEFQIHAKEYIRMKKHLNAILAECTGKPVEVVEKDTDRDNFMSAAESAAYGLVDHVIEHIPNPTIVTSK